MSNTARHKVALLWYRRDLRISDNPALQHALRNSTQVIPVYIFAPDEEAPWQPGAASRWWLHHSLTALSADLQKLGSRLVLRHGPSAKVLDTLIRSTGATAVFWNRAYEPALIARDTHVKQRLLARNIDAQSFNAALLVEPWETLTGNGTPYKVFTAFHRACKDLSPPRGPLGRPRNLRPAEDWPQCERVEQFDLLPKLDWTHGLAQTWQPGEKGAQRRLRHFSDGAIEEYPVARDLPATTGVSYLSPHLHFGEISPHQIWHSIFEPGAGRDAYLRQLAWRDFAHYLLFHFPDTAEKNFRREFDAFPWRRSKKILRAWCRGETGIPLVDAGMRELWHTGWMHNRVRMNVASFLTKNALIDWREGARWFWDTLVDADLANNTLGWQWSAGCGADAAPYFRVFNPVRQGERFDPDGDYVKNWLPQLAPLPAKYVHAPWRAPETALARIQFDLNTDYYEPVLDLQSSRDEALAAYNAMRGHKR